MKPIRGRLIVTTAITSFSLLLGAPQNAISSSGDDLRALIQAVELTTPLPGSQAPACGTFYSAQFGPQWPPMPADFLILPFWPLGDGFYIVDDRDVDYAALQTEDAESFSSMMASMASTQFAYGNPVYLTNMAAALNGSATTASFTIAGGTNNVPYDILTGTNLATPLSEWSWLGLGYTSNHYSFSNQPGNQGFYILAKPSKTMTVPWGDDTYGQCELPFGLTNIIAVSAGSAHMIALKTDDTVVTWGWLYGSGNYVPTNVTGGITAVAAGVDHNVALLTNQSVIAWGHGAFTEATNVPPSATNITVISAANFHNLALRTDGTVLGWGYYSPGGELPVPDGLSNIVAIAAGPDHDLAVRADGTVAAWGNNDAGQCNVPVGLSNVYDVAAGWSLSVALRKDGTVLAWGDDTYGGTNVPVGLSNVVAVAIGGYPFDDFYFYPASETGYGLALKKDGTVTTWGSAPAAILPSGLTGVFAISGGDFSAVALRSGPPTPAITLQPTDVYQLPGGSATFTAYGLGLYGVTYQWQFNGVNLAGETNDTLSLSNLQSTQFGHYNVVVSNEVGNVVSDTASLSFVTPPVIVLQTLPYNQVGIYQSNLTLPVVATAPAQNAGFPISYQWQFDGTNITGATGSSLIIRPNTNSAGTYSVKVSNAAGSTNTSWQLSVLWSGGLAIGRQPTDQYQIVGSNITFTCSALSSNAVTYQWQFGGTNIAGATNAVLTLANVQTGQEGIYAVVVSDSVNNLTSSNAYFHLVTPPVIVAQTLPTNIIVNFQSNVTLAVTISAPGQSNGFPLHYQWQTNGVNVGGATTSNYTFAATASGIYSVIVTNAAGATNATWFVNSIFPGGIGALGADDYHQIEVPSGLTNVIALSAGQFHSLAVRDDGTVIGWGLNIFGETTIPSDLSNVVAVAAGDFTSLALKADGTVAAWGEPTSPLIDVPIGLSNVVSIAIRASQCLALKKDGTVVTWDDGVEPPVPADLTNATAISAATLHSLALRSDGTVVGWADLSQSSLTNIPAGLTNVVAVSAGGLHNLALKEDGTVVAWGDNSRGQTNVPSGLSNVMAIAAGFLHSVALKNDGALVAWGDNTYGQTNIRLSTVKLIAAGGYNTLAAVFSPLVDYNVDVTKDLLLVYNSNSTNSAALKDYYLTNRPMISGANVLGVACDVGEFTTSDKCDAQIMAPVLDWLTNNPTKRPQYVIFSYDIPTRLTNIFPYNSYGSVSYHLHGVYPGWKPFVNHLNAGSLADCEAYVDKLSSMAASNSPGRLLISASATGYANTNFVLDGIRNGGPTIPPTFPYEDYTANGSVVSSATNGLLSSGVFPGAIHFYDGLVISNDLSSAPPHATGLTNVAGYTSWGIHGGLSGTYPNDGSVTWHGNSGWWIIETVESANGQRGTGQGNFEKWLSANSFGGTNYSHTPVGAVCHTEEPQVSGVEIASTYFGLWAQGKNFAICAWASQQTPYFQAVGDPFTKR